MKSIVGTQMYHWLQLYGQQEKNLSDHLDEALSLIKEAGLEAWETSIWSEEEAASLKSLLDKHGLKAPSIYAGGWLHHDKAAETVEMIIRQAKWGKELGATIVACNPDPISWVTEESKSDEELRTQAGSLVRITEALGAMGMTLAYHVHAPEFRLGAREFHHMMTATKGAGMGFCLDTHWIYRGAGNSQVALEDAMDMYGDRIVSTHLRQSHNGVWSEALEDGDIDYRVVAAKLKSLGFNGPHLLETALEEGTPSTMGWVDAYRKSRAYVKEIFAC